MFPWTCDGRLPPCRYANARSSCCGTGRTSRSLRSRASSAVRRARSRPRPPGDWPGCATWSRHRTACWRDTDEHGQVGQGPRAVGGTSVSMDEMTDVETCALLRRALDTEPVVHLHPESVLALARRSRARRRLAVAGSL